MKRTETINEYLIAFLIILPFALLQGLAGWLLETQDDEEPNDLIYERITLEEQKVIDSGGAFAE